MSLVYENLKKLNIVLPKAPAPAANYVPFVISGNIVFISGQISIIDGNLITGKVGVDIEISEGIKAARACGLAILAQLNEATDQKLDKVKKIVKLGGFVNCDSNFSNQPEIINGASDLMVEVFGNAGKHSRFAVGSNSLPRNVSVEIDAIAELK